MWKLILFLAISFAALLVRSAPTNYESGESEVETRNAMNFDKWQGYNWPDAKVPYIIDPLDSEQLELIHWAMDMIQNETCIRFVPRTNEYSHIHIKNGNGCYSFVGRLWWRGGQTLSLGNGCKFPKVVLHELMHALGFYHEAQRPDVDQHLKFNLENIKPGVMESYLKDLGGILPADSVNIEGQDYDFYSVMQGGINWDDVIDPKVPAIIPLREGVKIEDVGNVSKLSKLNIQDINRVYKCPPK